MIPEFLKPPTDNLYKFMTISGLVLLLVSAIYPPWLAHRTMLVSFEAQRDSELLELDETESKRREKRFEDEIALEDKEDVEIDKRMAEISERLKGRLAAAERSKLLTEVDEIKSRITERGKRRTELFNAYYAASTDMQKKNIELRHKLRVALWEGRNGKALLILCFIGAVVGVIVGRKGFNAWSLRVQVYQDAILKKQAETIVPSAPPDESVKTEEP